MRNDVYNNRFNIPVYHSLEPIYETLMEDPVKIYVMANTVFIGHIGLIIGKGEDAFLYDPAGSCSAQLNQDTFLKEFCSYSIGDRSPLAV
ncbi:hypothetical protein M2263_003001 [Providencia alcalifaciens]|nr:hypothetical protein [Providencia alcalifaciens]